MDKFTGPMVAQFDEGVVIEGQEVNLRFDIPDFPEVHFEEFKKVMSVYSEKDGIKYMGLLRYSEKSGGIPSINKLNFTKEFYKFMIQL